MSIASILPSVSARFATYGEARQAVADAIASLPALADDITEHPPQCGGPAEQPLDFARNCVLPMWWASENRSRLQTAQAYLSRVRRHQPARLAELLGAGASLGLVHDLMQQIDPRLKQPSLGADLSELFATGDIPPVSRAAMAVVLGALASLDSALSEEPRTDAKAALSKMALLGSYGHDDYGSTATKARAQRALSAAATTYPEAVRELATAIYRQPPGSDRYTPTKTAERYKPPIVWVKSNRAGLQAISSYFRGKNASEPSKLASALASGNNLNTARENIRETLKRLGVQQGWINEQSQIYEHFQELLARAPSLGRQGNPDDYSSIDIDLGPQLPTDLDNDN